MGERKREREKGEVKKNYYLKTKSYNSYTKKKSRNHPLFHKETQKYTTTTNYTHTTINKNDTKQLKDASEN
jgi:hypothetical protein